MFGCVETDLLGRDVDDLVPGSGYSMRLRTGELPDEITSLLIAGRQRLTRINVTPSGPSFICRLEAVVDKDLLYRLVATEHRWRALSRETDDGIAVIGLDGRIVEHNASFIRLLGLPMRAGLAPQSNALAGHNLFRNLPPCDSGHFARVVIWVMCITRL